MGAKTSKKTTPAPEAPPEISPWTTSIAAAAVLAATGAVGDAAHIPVLAAGLAVPGALATIAVSIRNKKHDAAATVYRLGCWAGAGGWMAAVLAGPHNWYNIWALLTLGAGAATAAILDPIANPDSEIVGAQPSGALTLYKGGRRGQEWSDRIYRVCNRLNVEVSDVVDWPTKTGYNVHALLPLGGSTVDDIKRATKQLATDARLPRGCALRVVEGNLQGEVVISVPTVNRLRENIPFVADHTPRSILKPLRFPAEYQDGRAVELMLRQASTLLVGMKGSGKTTLLDLFTYLLGHCIDALVWHVDLNGGGMSWAWMQPWINGQTDRPPIDLTATTPEEALIMVTLAYAIGTDRKGSYNHLKMQQNTRLMPLSRDLPAIHIVVDEGKSVLSTTARGIIGQIRDMLIKIQDELRDAGITVDASSLRATQTAIDPDFKVQVGNKIAMRTQTDAEIAYLLDWLNLKADDLPPYCGYIQFDQDAPEMFKAAEILPSDIAEGAIHIANMRPELDAAGARLGGDWYANRYARMRETFARALDADGNPQSTTDPTVLEPTSVVTPMFGRPGNGPAQQAGSPSDWEDPLARFNQPQPTPGRRPSEWADPLAGFGQPAAGSTLTQATVQAVPTLLTRALAVFNKANDDRVPSKVLAQALGFGSTNEMADLLRLLDVRPLASWFMRNGEKVRGYARESFVEAAERVARGDLNVPNEVAEWPAA